MKALKKARKADRYNLFTRFVRRILMIIKKRPRIILSTKQLPKKAIYISNHSGAAGPLTISMYFPIRLVPWGAHPMTEHYFKRWQYLYHVFYQMKLKYSKSRSWILATLFGIVSKGLYDGVQLIPTYPDARLRQTMKLSIDHLNLGNSVLIFPEDSQNGYHDEIKTFHSGFVYLAKKYFAQAKQHIDIVPLFYNKQKNTIDVGQTYRLDDFYPEIDRKDIADKFKDIMNQLGKN